MQYRKYVIKTMATQKSRNANFVLTLGATEVINRKELSNFSGTVKFPCVQFRDNVSDFKV